MKKRTVAEFIDRANIVHDNKFLYKKAVYTDSWTKLTITCPIHGDWRQEPANHLAGHGCPQCKYDKVASLKRHTADDFIERANRVHSHKYDYSNVDYKNTSTKVHIVCPHHGSFMQVPHAHIGKRAVGCPDCGRKRSKGEETISQILSDNDIQYVPEKSFEGLRGKRKHLQYDFWLPAHNILIEYDGIQHTRKFNFTSCKRSGELSFSRNNKNDKIKNSYAAKQGISLIRIPHTCTSRSDITERLSPYFQQALV